MLSPDIAVITAIDKSHISRFNNPEGITIEVCAITKHMKDDGVVIINIDEFTRFDLLNGKKTITISTVSKEADFHAEDIQVLESGLHFRIIVKESNESYSITLNNIFAKHNVICALYAFAAGFYNHAEPANMVKALSSFKTEGARQNIIKTENDIVIYADCYNAIARSIESAIDAASNIPIKGKRIMVLGDIEEAGDISDTMHQETVELVNKSNFDVLLTLGEKMKKAVVSTTFRDSLYVQHFTSISELSTKIKEIVNNGDLILFKASNASNLSSCIKIVWPKVYEKMFDSFIKEYNNFRRNSLLY